MINTQNVWWDFKAFTLTCKSFLPKPDGPTSRVVFSEETLLVDMEVKKVLEGESLVPSSGNLSNITGVK